jgi:predicted MPP superfamily phosphohydrolase
MRNSPLALVLIGLMVLLDFYVFQSLKVILHAIGPKMKSVIFTSYWVLSVSMLVLFVLLPYLNLDNYPKGVRNVIFALIIAIFFSKMIVALFLLIDDIRRGIQWIAGKLFFANTEGADLQEGEHISRSIFLSWIGLAAGGSLFASLVYGLGNKYNYQLTKIRLQFANLPPAFKGMKVIQISDVHSGSFSDKAAVQRGIDKILLAQPDLILFTGDLVNNKADEMEDYIEMFKGINAPLGVYSVLGNHDYGDYVQWPAPEEKVSNLNRLKNTHAQLGWKLLLNENVVLEKNGNKIGLMGVENWSAKARFPKYGKLANAYSGLEDIPFKILMSHDPSHWDAEVLPKYKDIDLMLSGHTHGMQFGVEIPWLKWSPVQYVYKQWAGLYEHGAQKLYINRGFGFIGYPGRVGILPEITLFELS